MRNLLISVVLFLLCGFGTGCSIKPISEATDGAYHRLTGGNGVYLTIKKNATRCMITAYDNCRRGGKAASTCGTETLRIARGAIESTLSGRALQIWNGQYSIFGYHPNIGKGFRDGEGSDFATAVSDLRARGHQCLRVHWKPTGTNWTTTNSDCYWGEKVKYNGTEVTCPAP